MDRLRQKFRSKNVFGILVAAIAAHCLSGYVLLGDKPYKLEVPADTGKVLFYVAAKSPHIVDKSDFAEGRYMEYSDDDFFTLIVQAAMDKWNAVPGTALQLLSLRSAPAQQIAKTIATAFL